MKNENDIKIAITIVEQFKDFSGLKLNRQNMKVSVWVPENKTEAKSMISQCTSMVMSPVDQVWPKPSCKAQ